jgi:hypothetical protein
MKVSINVKIKKGPWGGGNLFLVNLEKFLKINGHQVIYHLRDSDIDIILLFDPRNSSEMISYTFQDIANYLFYKNSKTKVIHRINECDERKNTKGLNQFFISANKVADQTIFVSKWLENIYIQQGLDSSDYKVILSGSDNTIFNQNGKIPYTPGKKLKIVTHHWGSNWNKGFEVYQALDKLISEKKFSHFEFTYIGNLPKNFKFKNMKYIPPLVGEELADELKKHHLYLTASINEPSGNHHIEGGLCGLPILYLESGGVTEYAKNYGLGFNNSNFREKLLEITEGINSYEKLMKNYPFESGKMCQEYLNLMIELMSKKRTNFNFKKIKSNRMKYLFFKIFKSAI